MGVLYNLVAKIGEYKDQQGNMKSRYVTVGVVMDGRNQGEMVIRLDTVPVGANFNGWIYMQEPRQRQGNYGRGGQRGGGQQRQQQGHGTAQGGGYGNGGDFDNMDEDVPFE